MVFTISPCMSQTFVISHRLSFFLLVEISEYPYRGIGKTYVSPPAEPGAYLLLINTCLSPKMPILI